MAGFFSKKQYAAIADKELAIKLLNDYYNVFILYKRKILTLHPPRSRMLFLL